MRPRPVVLLGSSFICCLGWGLGCSNSSDPPPPYANETPAGGANARSIGGTRSGGRAGSVTTGGGAARGGQAGSGPGNGGGGGVSPNTGGTPTIGGNGQGGAAPSGGSSSGGSGMGQAAGGPNCGPASPACDQHCTMFSTACGQNYDNCVCSCEQTSVQFCAAELASLQTCAGASPQIDCGSTTPIRTCEKQSFALMACEADSQGALCAKTKPSCVPYCEGLISAHCPRGIESFTGCLCDCEARLVPGCGTQFSAFALCTTDSPSFSCNAKGYPDAASCSPEWTALKTCDALQPGVDPP